MADWLRGVVADKVLHKVLGKFVSGIDKDALDLDLGMGDIALHSLALNLETFEALDLPFHVAGGTLGQVRVKVPWRNITNEPTKIVIDRVYLLLSPKDASPVSADAREAAAAAAKREFLEGWEAQQERKREQKQGFGAYVGEQVEKLVRSILQKLQISITNVHVRIQQGVGAGGVAAGVSVRSIQVTDMALADAGSARHSSDTHLASMLAQLVRKSVRIEGLAVYLSGSASGGASGVASGGATGGATHTDRAAWERLMVPMLEARTSLPDHILPPLDVKLEVEFDPADDL
jgi:vacuolar protein sorting-associated protein 13A/C